MARIKRTLKQQHASQLLRLSVRLIRATLYDNDDQLMIQLAQQLSDISQNNKDLETKRKKSSSSWLLGSVFSFNGDTDRIIL